MNSDPQLRYPDFLGIGAQKAGTTWLDKNLRRHPQLWFPPIKELNYFNDLYVPSSRRWTADHRRRRGKQVLRRYLEKIPRENWDYRYIARAADIVEGPISDEWYGRIFSLAQSEQICGEISPDYCTLPDDGICHILRLMPDVKIILSLRDPIDRSWSHIRMLAKTRNTGDVSKFEQFACHPDVIGRADYPAIISSWRKQIPSERIQLVFMDEIVDKPLSVLENICTFLGIPFVSKRFAKAADPIHVGESMTIPPTVYAVLKERLKPVYDQIAVLYPEIAATWSGRHY